MATIRLDLDRTLGPVDPRLFGNFIEHLGRCIYGGIYEPGSPLADEHGFRRDVVAAIRPLRIPVLRWPGGNFVSGYHWTDGIGPVDKRPRKLELAWHAEEPNTFGTDEFIRFCRHIGTEPFICVNMGTDTIDGAQAWVEYCNGTGNTYWANLRRQHGHPEPYRVRYWGLGNEMYGSWQIGAQGVEDYIRKARAFARVMKWTDPTIELVSCGQNGWNDWDQAVIEGLAPFVEWHSIHLYTGSADYYRNVLMPHAAERALRICQATIERVRHAQNLSHPIYVAFDEWNIWYRERSPEARRSGIEERYNLADALAAATFLNVFIRFGQVCRMANLAQLVNVIAPIFTSREGLFLQTIYHPLRLYAEHTQPVALDPYVDSGHVPFTAEMETETSGRPWRVADLGPFQRLDVAATRDDARRQLTVAVVNRDRDAAITARIELSTPLPEAGVTAAEVNGPHPDAVNSFEHPDAVAVTERPLGRHTGLLDYTFPPHSLTVLRFDAR